MNLPSMKMGEMLRAADIQLVVLNDAFDPEFKGIGTVVSHDGGPLVIPGAGTGEGHDLSDISAVDQSLIVQDSHQVTDHSSADDRDGSGKIGVENDGGGLGHLESPVRGRP